MEAWIGLTTVLLPLIDLILWGSYLWLFYTERDLARRWSRLLMGTALFAHAAHVGLQSIAHGRLPLTTPLEFLSLLSLSLLVLYVVIERGMRVRQTGFLVVGLVFVMQFISSGFTAPALQDDPLLNDAGFTGHVILILLAYTALSLSFLYAVLYTVQERQLRRRSFGLLFRRLPPLESLEKMSVGAVRLGVPLLFLSLVSGHLWMYSLRDKLPSELAVDLTPFDPKIIVSWLVLLGYTVGLVGHARWGWRGRRMNRLAIIAFLVMVVSMGLARYVLPSFHDFRLGLGV